MTHRRRFAPHPDYYRQAASCAAVGGVLYLITLLIGTISFYVFEGLNWLDAAVNSTMLMSQLGQITTIQSTAMKVFLLVYAPFASIGFFGGIGVLIYPWIDLVVRHFRLEPERE